MISNFNEEAQIILNNAKNEMIELKHPYIGTEHLILSILHSNNNISQELKKYNLTYNIFKKEILNIIGKGSKKSDFFLYTPLLKKVIENAILDSKENNHGEVTINHLFAAILDIGEGIAIRILLNMNIDIDKIYDIFMSKIYNNNFNKKLLVEEIGININSKAKNKEIDPLIGRNKEIEKIEEILSRRTKNNPLLIGEPGVGKTAIIEGLAELIEKKQVPKKLLNKKIISLDMASIVAGTKYRGEFEEKMKNIIKEVEENNDIILFIDEIHTIIGAGGADGAIDASNILKPSLARGKIRCIGATTIDEYKKSIQKDKALERRFQIINIEEPTIDKTKKILLSIKPIYEKYHNVIIKNEIIDEIISLSEKYIYNKYRPDKEIDILDNVCSKVSILNNKNNIKKEDKLIYLRNKKEQYIKNNNIKKAYEYKIKETKYKNIINDNKIVITKKDVINTISTISQIPIYEMTNNQERIKKIEKTLQKKIYGQNNAIKELIKITKKILLGYNDNKITTLLFIGPIGVGKTELAINFAKLISKQKIIRLNMSEYNDQTSINKFIGSSSGYIGYDDNNYVLSKIKDNPNSVIILDEIEKAHPKIINLIQEILEEGKIEDAKNNIINFSNNIIIMTSNIEYSKKNIGFNKNENNKIEILNNSFQSKIDNIIKFNYLEEKDIIKIIENNLNKIKKKYKNKNIEYKENIIKEIIKESKYKEYGGKLIDKIITNLLENNIIDNIINNNNNDIIINSIFS